MESAMRCFRPLILLAAFVSINVNTTAQTPSPPVPPEWLTHAEKTDYRETPTYDDTMAYARRLVAASPWLRMVEFGRSGEGRALQLVVASKDRAFTPQAAKRAGKPVVLIQACIHAGETDGKDAGLALLRDIAVTKARAGLLDRATVLFIPIYNADGHERRSPYNRINQNGPAEMGWRANATNLNLNRDYMKADAPETRAWLRLWNEWQPDLFIDCHVTDGADFRYNVTYQFEKHENVLPSIRAWSTEAFARRILPAAERDGNLFSTYLVFRDNRDPAGKGVEGFIATPRFATGYVPVARNRPALLIETHMLKEHRSRVRGTYDILVAALEDVNRDPEGLLRAVRQADEQTVNDGRTYDPARRVPLSVRFTDKPTPMLLKGWAFRTEQSDISGQARVIWDTSRPQDQTVPFYDEAAPAASVAPPLYYIIPPQWKEAIGVLAAHGLRMSRLAAPARVKVETYRLSDVKFAPSSFEGHVMVSFKSETFPLERTFPAGSAVVPMAQPAARAALQLLEPSAPDSLAAWGFFHSVLEQKESGEDYVLEKLAREMLAKDEKLRQEFERRLREDPKFAASPAERLRFFHERSPYWDPEMYVYPVGRITAPLNVRLID
ncbi:MAG TPA: M14 family metallopeptidase [Pyrinomonadaceae bacterium]|jgi:murein tripeptide amidase MpaA|nr:M14 family metallopeptidase [Pyrinomonadaceae bacterium]